MKLPVRGLRLLHLLDQIGRRMDAIPSVLANSPILWLATESHGQMNRGAKTLLLGTGRKPRQVRLILPKMAPLHSPAWQLRLLALLLALLDSPEYARILRLSNINQCSIEVLLRGSKTQTYGSPYRNHQSPR